MKKVIDDERLMVKICDMYYNQDMSQKQIADQLGLSRPTISRMIAGAKEQGIVTITIKNLEDTDYVDLERTIETIYDLKEVIVVAHEGNPERQKQTLGKAAASYLKRVIKDNSVVGVSMGTTLYSVVSQIDDVSAKNVLFVPLIGGMGHLRSELHSNSLVEILARKYGGEYIPMYAPARVSNRMIRTEFQNEKSIARVIKMCNKLDVALVGIGYPSKSSSIMATGYYAKDEMKVMKSKQVTGDICMQFYDEDGNTEPYKKENTVIGIELKKLRKVPHSIGVAAGSEKLSAIRGAIRGKYINTLITDVECAKRLAENK